MKILQTGDWHIEEKRLPEQVRCIEHMLTVAEKAGIDAYMILGDIFGSRVPYHATERERLAFIEIVHRMTKFAPVLLLYGNHDAPLCLDGLPFVGEVHVISRPEVVHCCGSAIVAFPYPRKAYVVGTEGPSGIESLRLDLSQRLFEILRGLLLSVTTPECILVGHCNIGGSRTGGGEILAGQEIELSKAQLGELFEIQPKLSYVGLGHIHRAQEIIPGAWYAGTPSSQGWDGCNEHGFLIIDTNRRDQDAGPMVKFIPTPAVRHYTIDVEWIEDGVGGKWGPYTWTPSNPTEDLIKGAMIKLRPRIPESCRKQADYTRLVDELRVEGATVIVDPCVIPHARQREVALTVPPPADVAVRGKASLREGLAQLWQSQKPAPAMDVQARALELLEG